MNKINLLYSTVLVILFSSCINFSFITPESQPRIFKFSLEKEDLSQNTPTGTSISTIIAKTPTPSNTDAASEKLTEKEIVPETKTSMPTPNNSPQPSISSSTPADPHINTIQPNEDLLNRIIFICEIFKVDGRNQICTILSDGSDYKRVTMNDFSDYKDPIISPEKTNIIVSEKKEKYDIYEIDQDNQITQLTDEKGDSYSPQVSPDGQFIVFTYEEDFYRSIWLMNRDGNSKNQLFGPPQGEGWSPVWSPDGNQIMFFSGEYKNPQIYIVDSDGINYRQVSDFEGIYGRSDWIPDGSKIAFSMGKPGHHEIFLYQLDDSELAQITSGGNNISPRFPSDGEWIVYYSYGDDKLDQHACEIYKMRVNGSEHIRLTENSYCDWMPSW